MDPEMIRKIEAALDRVKDPESALPIAHLGVVERIRYNEKLKALYVFTNFQSHFPGCPTCAAIASAVVSTIVRDLTTELQTEFPDLTVEFV